MVRESRATTSRMRAVEGRDHVRGVEYAAVREAEIGAQPRFVDGAALVVVEALEGLGEVGYHLEGLGIEGDERGKEETGDLQSVGVGDEARVQLHHLTREDHAERAVGLRW